MRNREECRAGSKYNLMQKTSPQFERIGLWARGKSAGVSETSFCGLQRERGEIWSRKGDREEGRSDNAEKGGTPNTNFVQEAK